MEGGSWRRCGGASCFCVRCLWGRQPRPRATRSELGWSHDMHRGLRSVVSVGNHECLFKYRFTATSAVTKIFAMQELKLPLLLPPSSFPPPPPLLLLLLPHSHPAYLLPPTLHTSSLLSPFFSSPSPPPSYLLLLHLSLIPSSFLLVQPARPFPQRTVSIVSGDRLFQVVLSPIRESGLSLTISWYCRSTSSTSSTPHK